MVGARGRLRGGKHAAHRDRLAESKNRRSELQRTATRYDSGWVPQRQSKTGDPRGRSRFLAVFASHSASAAEDADAAGRSSLFCCRTRRSSSGANLGTDYRTMTAKSWLLNHDQWLGASYDFTDLYCRHLC